MKNPPKKVDLRKKIKDIPIYDQGGLGSSVSCGMSSLWIAILSKKPINFLYYKTSKLK
jgi:hypothetical protein